MSIAIGGNSASKIYLGGDEVSKMYLGDTEIWSNSSSRLPAGYTEVDYISSDGTYYIDSGINQTTRNYILEIKFKWTGSTISQFETFFGYMAASGITPRCGIHKYNGKWMYGTNATNTTSISVDNNVHVARLESKATGNTESFYLDGNLVSTTSTSSTGLNGNTIPFYMFCRNRKTSSDNPAIADIYYVKYTTYNSSYSMILSDHYFVPCYDSNNNYGYYDIVNNLFKQKTSL